jgi:FHA domain
MKLNLRIDTNGLYETHPLIPGKIFKVGRSKNAHFIIHDPKCSSFHCSITLNQNHLEITDLHSKNGTFLNGIRIEKSEIFIGDEIRIGQTILSIDVASLDDEARNLLTFDGDKKGRFDFAIRADFTGARLKKLSSQRKTFARTKLSPDTLAESEPQKREKRLIRLSREEFFNKHKTRALICHFVNLLIPLLLISAPLFVSFDFTDRNILIIVILELIIQTLFAYFNYRLSHFSVGERISGLKNLYQNQ